MASVSKRRDRDGATSYLVRWRDEANAQRKRSFARKIDADRFRTQIEHSLNTGTYVDPSAGKVTFETYAEAWRAKQLHRTNTANDTRSRLRTHVYPTLGTRQLATIRPTDIEALVSRLSQTLSPTSVRTVMATTTGVLRAAVRDGLIPSNPAAGIKLPTVARRQVVPLEARQVYAISDALPERYAAMPIVGAGTGLRPGELLGLQVRDIDFLRRTLRVERQIQRGAVAEPKNANAHRTIPVASVVIDVLADHLRRSPAGPDGFVFTNERGLPLRYDVFTRDYWRPACRSAGVAGVGMHTLRHTYASALIASGQSPRVVADRLGHANAAMTLNVYAHLWPADDDRSRTAVDAMLAPDAPRLRPAEVANGV